MAAFEEFGVLPEIGKAVEEMGWTLPTDVQAEAIPLILGGGDVLMAAETGSGKTGAFCLPVLQITWESLRNLKSGNVKSAGPDTRVKDSDWRMSINDRGSELAMAPDGLHCQSRNQRQWHGVRASKGVSGKGRYYYEASVEDEGLCRVGFSTAEADLDLGTCPNGYGFGGTGKKSNNRQFDDFGEPFGKGDCIGCYIDLDNQEIYFTKNGVDLGLAFTIPKKQSGKTFFPAILLKNAEMTINFGNRPWRYKPVEDYIGFSSAPEKYVSDNNKNGAVVQERKIVANAPQAIIIEPSRELAVQTLSQITSFKKHLGVPTIKELLVVGGVNVREQIEMLKAGVDIVVATPGRLEDLISTGQMSLKQCRFFILDEADGLLKSGYENLIKRLHGMIPTMTSDGARLQMIVCSATLHSFEVKKLADTLMHFPTWVDLKGEDAVPETVHHVVVPVDPRSDLSWSKLGLTIQTDGVHAKDRFGPGINSPESLSEAVKLLKAEYCVRAIRHHKMNSGIIFCRTKLDCDNLENYFKKLGGGASGPFSCLCLHGDKSPAERDDNLRKFKENKVKFLICSEVVARGLDVKGLPFVINMTLPDEKSNYVHRIGRVGRAERMGLAISLVGMVQEKVWYHKCPSKGKNCFDTRLTDKNGCCIWYNEPQYLADIEEHLGETIQQISNDMEVQANEYDGKVVYGQKKVESGTGYQGHAVQLAPALAELAHLERDAQNIFLKKFYGQKSTA